MKKLLLFSGGIDSSALSVWSKPDVGVFIDYGQIPAPGELRAAKAVADAINLPLVIINVNCSEIGSGLLSGTDNLPISPSKEWWPFRNQLLITFAGAWALKEGVEHILVGAVKTDGFHADGTQPFIDSINSLMTLQEGGISVSAPAIEITTVELVKASGIRSDILGWTHSCHQGEFSCGVCPGCIKHKYVLKELGIL